jgi:hypothetical protein
VQQNITNTNGCKLLEYFNPALLVTVAHKKDNPALKEAMNSPDAAGFMKAMETELDTSITMKAFIIIDKKNRMNTVSSVWAFNNRIPVMVPLTAPLLGSFLWGHISLKNRTYCPLFRHDTTSFKYTCFLISKNLAAVGN